MEESKVSPRGWLWPIKRTDSLRRAFLWAVLGGALALALVVTGFVLAMSEQNLWPVLPMALLMGLCLWRAYVNLSS